MFTTSLDIYLNKAGIIPLKPSQFFLPLFFGISILSYGLNKYLRVFSTHTFKALMLFFILSILYAINTDTAYNIVIVDVFNKLITLFLYVMAILFFENNNKKFITKLFFISIIILGLSIWYDTFFNLKHGIDILRKGGFAENPNVGASAMKFLGFALLILITKSRLRIVVLFFVLITIFITFSRGGLISFTMLVILMLINQWRPNFNLVSSAVFSSIFKAIVILLLSYIVVFNMAVFIQNQIPSFSEGTAGDRIDMILGKKKKNNSVFNDDDKQKGGRVSVAKNYLEKFKKNPFGYGSGYTADYKININNTHNYYLTTAINYGFLGLFVLLWFIFKSFTLSIKFNYYYYLVFILLFVFECFISNGALTEKALIIVIAFMDQRLYKVKDENI